jgi:hypothetical protein
MKSTIMALAIFCGGASAATLHVDCSRAADTESAPSPRGSEKNPIDNLDELNAIRLEPGTHVLFKRGATCHGSFKPAAGSSGTAAAPIVVDAYGDKSAPRPVIAAGCMQAATDPTQSATESRKTPKGVSEYASLCKADDAVVNRAAIHLHNVQHWEINTLELSNDALTPGARVGLLVQLEDFGTGHHYRVDNVYVHHVRGLLKDEPDGKEPYKATGGVLFAVTRDAEVAGHKQKPTRFNDVVVENSEVYNVDAIGLSNRSAWQCRLKGAPCGDYPPYKGNTAYMTDPATQATSDFFPSTGITWRNNKIHNVGGDGIIVRTATSPVVESNLVYDVWMRTPGNSAGAWAINTDGAVFRYNEVHGVRRPHVSADDDGMAFDADLGARHSRFHANFSHDNDGGMMLFCGCGEDGFGNPGMAFGTVVEDNLSIDDGKRLIFMAGSEQSVVRNNIAVARRQGLVTPIIENGFRPWKNEVELRGNRFYNASDRGALFLVPAKEGRYAEIAWSGNAYFGYASSTDFASGKYSRSPDEQPAQPFAGQDVDAVIQQWLQRSGFQAHKYAKPSAN